MELTKQITSKDFTEIGIEIYKKWEQDYKKGDVLYSVMQGHAEDDIAKMRSVKYKEKPSITPDFLPYFVVEMLIEKGYINSAEKN